MVKGCFVLLAEAAPALSYPAVLRLPLPGLLLTRSSVKASTAAATVASGLPETSASRSSIYVRMSVVCNANDN